MQMKFVGWRLSQVQKWKNYSRDGLAHACGIRHEAPALISRAALDPKASHGRLTSDDPARKDGAPAEFKSGTDE
jgi:hypothetical protein